MIESWLDFPFWLGCPPPLVWLTTAAALWWFFQRSRLAPFWRDNLGVVAPTFPRSRCCSVCRSDSRAPISGNGPNRHNNPSSRKPAI